MATCTALWGMLIVGEAVHVLGEKVKIKNYLNFKKS
jgi:hypothetical protein